MTNTGSDYRPTTVRTSNVTVTSMGIAFDGPFPVWRTCYEYPNTRIKGVALAMASQIKRQTIKVEMENNPAMIHSQWSHGYYHWVTESLVRAMVAKDFDPSCTFIIPNTHNSFHAASLKLLDFDYEFFPAHNIKLQSCIITSCPKTYASTQSELLIRLRRKLIECATSRVNLGERIYISRSIARGRKISNEENVCALLERYGFHCITAESFSFDEQVSIFKHAKCVVSIHGAGLTNMLFMEPGSSIIEILPFRNGIFDLRPNSLSLKHDHCYRTLANGSGHNHFYLQCAHDKYKFQRTNLADLTVDCEELERVIRGALGSQS